MILREKLCLLWRLNWFLILLQNADFLYYEEKRSNQAKTVNDVKNLVKYQKAAIYIIVIVVSFLLLIPFPWRET